LFPPVLFAGAICRSLQISHARRAGEPYLLNKWAI